MSGATVVLSTNVRDGQVACSIRDNGPGVPAGRAVAIFRPFVTTKPRGTGLGLATSRRLIELHGGRLWLENPGEPGACFTFTLPVFAGHEQPGPDPMARDRILVVDDDQLQRWAMGKHLTAWNYEVIEAADGQSGLEAFTSHLPDLVLLDLQLPDQTGVDVLRQIRAIDPQAVVIMVTAHGGVPEAVAAFKLGVFDYLAKPLDFDALGVTLRFGLEARHLRTEVERLRAVDRAPADTTIVGNSPAIRNSVAMLGKLAASGASAVLLTGESGTGKDLVAKALHYQSPRSGGPFVAVNCAAIPDTLMESELFGHEKGAFTDARFLKKGLFELADGGTLYLDEIGELKMSLQPKMLRVLETLTFRRVGSVARHHRRSAHRGRHQPRSGRRRPAGRVSTRPAVPAARVRDDDAAAARAPRGHPGAGAALPPGVRAQVPQARHEGLATRPWTR